MMILFLLDNTFQFEAPFGYGKAIEFNHMRYDCRCKIW